MSRRIFLAIPAGVVFLVVTLLLTTPAGDVPVVPASATNEREPVVQAGARADSARAPVAPDTREDPPLAATSPVPDPTPTSKPQHTAIQSPKDLEEAIRAWKSGQGLGKGWHNHLAGILADDTALLKLQSRFPPEADKVMVNELIEVDKEFRHQLVGAAKTTVDQGGYVVRPGKASVSPDGFMDFISYIPGYVIHVPIPWGRFPELEALYDARNKVLQRIGGTPFPPKQRPDGK